MCNVHVVLHSLTHSLTLPFGSIVHRVIWTGWRWIVCGGKWWRPTARATKLERIRIWLSEWMSEEIITHWIILFMRRYDDSDNGESAWVSSCQAYAMHATIAYSSLQSGGSNIGCVYTFQLTFPISTTINNQNFRHVYVMFAVRSFCSPTDTHTHSV